MTYIYDILLNFNEEYYDFYDWNKEDRIIHIKKIPIYRINDKDLKNIISSTVIFENKFLDMIKDRTEVFLRHEIKNIKFCCLLCGKEKIIAVNLNENGKVIAKSDLLIDEYNEIINVIEDYTYTQVNYVIENKNEDNNFTTRRLKEKNKFVIKELDSFTLDELEYIYYECFSENENSKQAIIKKLYEYNDQEQLYKLVKIISRRYKKIK